MWMMSVLEKTVAKMTQPFRGTRVHEDQVTQAMWQKPVVHYKVLLEAGT